MRLLSVWFLSAMIPAVALAEVPEVPQVPDQQEVPDLPFRPLPKQVPIPKDNPQTDAKIDLGRELYFDPRLSFTGKVSCNSCHHLDQGGEDGQAVSVGALGKAGRRSAPTLWNVGFETAYFWDGRANSIEDVVKEHVLDETVMAIPAYPTLTGRLQSITAYRERFAAAFGHEKVAIDDVAKALASFVRTLVTPDSPFDRYLQGDQASLSEEAVRGYALFNEKGCAACHFWTLLAGPVPGLSFKPGQPFYELFPTVRGTPWEERLDILADEGAYDWTGREDYRHMWRVPTLRNIELTAPYFHNGSVKTLPEAVQVMSETQFGIELSEDEIAAIVEFLKTQTGVRPAMTPPEPLR